MLLQLLVPFVTWSVVNVTAEVKDFRFIFLDTNRVFQEEFVQLVINLSTVSVPVCLFQVDAGTMLYLGDCDIHLKTNEVW